MSIKINKNKYQLFIMKSRVPLPFSFAYHTWSIINEKGKLTRIDLGKEKRDCICKGHIQFNREKPFNGQEIIEGIKKIRWNSQVIYEKTLDKKTIKKLNNEINLYPKKEIYKPFPGPNSNTFTQYVINKLKLSTNLPKMAIGKNFKW